MKLFNRPPIRNNLFFIIACLILQIQTGHAQTIRPDSISEAILPGLDYSLGRVVPGFGFTLDQYLEEQIEGNRELASAFGVLFHPSSQMTFDLFSAADAKRVNFREYLDYPANPISSAWHFQSRLRIANSFEIKPFYSKTTSEERYNTTVLQNEQNISEKGEFTRYGAEETYLSNGGALNLTPTQRIAFTHLNGCLITAGKHQWLVHGMVMHQKESQSGYGQLIGLIEGVEKLYQKQATRINSTADSLHFSVHYGIDANFLAGLHAGGTIMEEEEKDGIAPNYTRFGAVRTSEWFLDHDSNLYWSKHFLQLTSLRWTHHREKISNIPGAWNDPIRFDPAIRFSISLIKLPDYQVPSSAQLLTETSGIFQKRLPAGQWLFGLNGTFQTRNYGTYQSELSSNRFSYNTLILSGKMEKRMLDASADFRFGVNNYLEACFESHVQDQEIRAGNTVTGVRLTDQSWMQRLSLRFANYRYSPSDEERYGWTALDNFQKQFLPMLDRGMIKGVFQTGYFSYEKDLKFRGVLSQNDPLFKQYVALLQNLKWNFTASCDWGITRFLTLSESGAYSVFQSDEREFGDKDWEWVTRLTWQPFNGFRVELNYQAIRYINYFKSRYHYQIIPYYYEYAYQYYDRTVRTWNVRLLSLF